jgi:hypothetical protein
MRVQILQKVQQGEEYAYHPGQVIIDHPDEQVWLEAGVAREIPEEPETAVLTESESTVLARFRRKAPPVPPIKP